jgi:hemerythrin-like domain-containing protein
MIIERLSREHRNIEMLLAILERELEIFDRGGRPDYEVIRAIISYFELYPEVYHHPQEDLVFAKLKIRDATAAAKVGNLALEHQKGAERLRRVAQAVDSVLADREILRQNVDNIVRDFIEHERRHIMMEDRDFFPAALKALEPQDWTEIASAMTTHEDPLFSEAAEEIFDALRARILQLEQERLKPNDISRAFIRIALAIHRLLLIYLAILSNSDRFVPHSMVWSWAPKRNQGCRDRHWRTTADTRRVGDVGFESKSEVRQMSFLDPRRAKKKDRLAAASPSLTDARSSGSLERFPRSLIGAIEGSSRFRQSRHECGP